MKTAQSRVNDATSLNELCTILNTINEELRENGEFTLDSLVELASLPLFSTNHPQNTLDIFSYDDTRQMVTDGGRQSVWSIEARTDFEEAGSK